MATTRKMTAPGALRRIAKDLWRDKQRVGYVWAPFLCNRVDRLYMCDLLSWREADRIKEHIRSYLPEGRLTFDDGAFDLSDRVEERILLALWVALDIEEEDRARRP